jgi:hypothetical protein
LSSGIQKFFPMNSNCLGEHQDYMLALWVYTKFHWLSCLFPQNCLNHDLIFICFWEPAQLYKQSKNATAFS